MRCMPRRRVWNKLLVILMTVVLVMSVSSIRSDESSNGLVRAQEEEVEGRCGLRVDVYNDDELLGEAVFSERDAAVGLEVRGAQGVFGSEAVFSAQWTGRISSRHAGGHLFYVTVVGGGVRLRVGDVTLTDAWWDHTTPTEHVGAFSFEEGESSYPILLQFRRSGAMDAVPANLRLEWLPPMGSDGGSRQPLPLPCDVLTPASDAPVSSCYDVGTTCFLNTQCCTRICTVGKCDSKRRDGFPCDYNVQV